MKKDASQVKVVVNGGGAAGLSITEMLLGIGIKNIIICDTKGAIYKDRKENMNEQKYRLAELTNPNNEKGRLEDVVKGADAFIGVSAPKVLTKEMV